MNSAEIRSPAEPLTRCLRASALNLVIAATLLSCAPVEPVEDFAATETALTEALIKSARIAEETYKFDAAAGHYHRLAERKPESIEPILGEARNLRYAGAPRQALKVLRLAMEQHGEKPPLLLELAKAQYASALPADSMATIETLRELTPDDWQVYAIQAMLKDSKELYVAARELYETALALSPENPTVINNFSLSLAQAGHLDDAIAILEPLARGEATTIQARQNLSMLYVLKGDYESAEKLTNIDLPADLALQNLSAFKKLTE